MRDLVEFMATGLVDNPDAVDIHEEDQGGRVVYHLYVADDDMGKVIGKQGRIANAMRDLLKVAAARNGARVSLEIGH
ncbi:MAG: KH domain-containing protein [Dehalococcoidia bacterium]